MKRALFLMLLVATISSSGCRDAATTGSHGRAPEATAPPMAQTPDDSIAAAAAAREIALSWNERCGEAIYRERCAVCHGLSGAGDGFNASNLDRPPQDFTSDSVMSAFPDSRLIDAVTSGGRAVGGTPMMPAYGKTFTAQDIRSVVAYVRTFAAKKIQ
jgi:mono/diheme cytochrome c family protein